MNGEVLTIARAVRKWTCDVYRRRIDSARRRGRRAGLPGMCAVASYELAIRLRAAGYTQVVIVFADVHFGSHCYVEMGEWIIDVTATQFGRHFKPVEVFRKDSSGQKYAQEPWWFSSGVRRKRYKTLDGFYRNVTVDWHESQRPIQRKPSPKPSRLNAPTAV